MKIQTKKSIAMIAVATTVSVIGVGAAEAASNKSVVKTTTVTSTSRPSIGGMMNDRGIDPITSVLAALVTNKTITQAQSDAITAALAAARPQIGQSGMGGGTPGFDKQAVILSTLGIDAATLQAGLQAGKSLATIAGTKTQALITALVAAETKAIDAAVTAGKMTTAQATTAKTGLLAHVTAEVNQVGPVGPLGQMGVGGRGHGHGMGDKDGNHLPGAPTTTTGNN
jgi:hypothetical protein